MPEPVRSVLRDDNLANKLRFTKVEPVLAAGGETVFDFPLVRNVTSSFSDDLVATLIARFPTESAKQVRDQGVTP